MVLAATTGFSVRRSGVLPHLWHGMTAAPRGVTSSAIGRASISNKGTCVPFLNVSSASTTTGVPPFVCRISRAGCATSGVQGFSHMKSPQRLLTMAVPCRGPNAAPGPKKSAGSCKRVLTAACRSRSRSTETGEMSSPTISWTAWHGIEGYSSPTVAHVAPQTSHRTPGRPHWRAALNSYGFEAPHPASSGKAK